MKKTTPPTPRSEPFLDRLSWWLALAALFFVPVIVSPAAFDPFRFPKELLLRGFAIAIAALFAMRCVVHGLPELRWRSDRVYAFTAIILGWTALTAAVARNRVLAAYSFLFAASAAVVFLAIYIYAATAERWVTVIRIVLAAAVLNAGSCLLARAGSSGMFFAMMGQRSIGLLGSPNDEGVYLAFAIVAAGAMTMIVRKYRWAYALVALFLIAALLTTQTIGAVVAIVGAALAAYWLVSRRNAAIATVIIALAGIAVVVGYAPLRGRVAQFLRGARSGSIDLILAGRATPFLAAARMTADRPLTGVGPGCFGYEYFPYKIAVEDDHPSLVFAGARTLNFGEVHNDHLQILAQSGIPAYVLFIAALIFVARCSFAAPPDDPRSRFGRVAALPLVVALAIVTIPEFVLELAAPTVTAVALASVCLNGRSGVEAD